MKSAKIINGLIDTISLDRPQVLVEKQVEVWVPEPTEEDPDAGHTETQTVTETVTVLEDEPGWIEVPDDAFAGFAWDGETATPTAPDIDLVAYAAARRYEVETGGIIINGAAIDTSRDSQAMITGAYAYSQANPGETIQFKAMTLDAVTMAAIATAVGAHVQAYFAADAAVQAAVTAGAITTTAEIDAFFAGKL